MHYDADAVRITSFRRRALEVRTIAAGIKDPKCRDNLLGLANDYDRTALSIELSMQREPYRNATVH